MDMRFAGLGAICSLGTLATWIADKPIWAQLFAIAAIGCCFVGTIVEERNGY